MATKKRYKTQNLQEPFGVENEVVRSGVLGQEFDILLRFNNDALTPELFMDENVKMVIEGMLERYGPIVVKINWWDSHLKVIVPGNLPEDVRIQNAPQGT